jgi:hypothetical protein
MNTHRKPSWWICYLICAVMIGLVVLDYWTPVSDTMHKLVACAIVLGGYGTMAWWLRSNRAGMAQQEGEAPVEHSASSQRDVPLSPVQANYLRVMEPDEQSRGR